ncbi:hypothetical protein SDC9_182473 [bioreactor metagenome]|uniref:Uncharacterized protein n=1 Tax=bioreactor metagenome TaxID=1076179 RepID=A0A645HA31_9ZZZZ
MKEFGWTIEYTLDLTYPIFLNLFVLIRRVRADRAIDEFYHPYTAGKFGGKCQQLLYDTRGSFYLDGNPERQFDPEDLKRAEERLDAITRAREEALAKAAADT